MSCRSRQHTTQTTEQILALVNALAKVGPEGFTVTALKNLKASSRKLTLILARVEQEINDNEQS